MSATLYASPAKKALASRCLFITPSALLPRSSVDASRSGVPLGVAQPAGIAPRAATRAVSVSARLGLGSGWVTTASFSEGLSQLDLRGSPTSEVREQSYSFSITKHGLFGDDSLGFAVTRPIQIYSGTAEITAADGVDPNYNLALNSERISLAGVKPETDIELGYVTTFLDGALALQANAAYQLNTQGQNGTNSLAVVSRAKIKF